jgi:multiple sugar transport system permease protein
VITEGAGQGIGPRFEQGVENSAFVATMVMVFTMVLSVPSGYALARFSFPFRTFFFFIIIFVRSIAPISILNAVYGFYKIVGLGGTYQGIILVDMTLTVPLIAWVSAGIFASIPRELDKQGRVDGCNRLRLIWNVLLPVAAPGLIVVAVLSWLTSWNEWLFALFLGDAKGLRLVSPVVAPSSGAGAALVVVSMIPAVVAAVILERYMTRLQIIAPPGGEADYGLGHPNK